MTRFLLYVALSSCLFLTACVKEEVDTTMIDITTVVEKVESVVDFSIDNTYSQVLEKDLLELTNNSENAVSYHWDFGNGDSSTDANPEYSYGKHGTFTVKLTITDKYGETKEMSHDITVICLLGGEDHGSF